MGFGQKGTLFCLGRGCRGEDGIGVMVKHITEEVEKVQNHSWIILITFYCCRWFINLFPGSSLFLAFLL